MSEILKQVNEAGTVDVVRTSALEVSELSHDVESLSLKKATVMLLLLAQINPVFATLICYLPIVYAARC